MLIGSQVAEAAIHYSGRVDVEFPPHKTKSKQFPLDQPGDFFGLTHDADFDGRATFEDKAACSAGFRGLSVQGVGVYLVSKLSFGQNISEGDFISEPLRFPPALLASVS